MALVFRGLPPRGSAATMLTTPASSSKPRATMLESEYLHAATEAKIRWFDSVLVGPDDGSITGATRNARPPPDSRIDPMDGWIHPMKPLRLAILSATGTAQKRTIPALVNSNLVTVSAIQGRNPEKLREVADRYRIQSIYTDEHKLLNEGSYDAVMICSSPYMHFSQAKRVIDRGMHCLLEKPAAMSAARATN
jgi:hypothetical protein